MPPKTLGKRKKHPLYNTYHNMLARCSSPKRWNYKFYGGRGIKVCDRWRGKRGFDYFIMDMGERPPNHQLDRKDVYGNYCPKNCRWVNKYTQMGNTTANNLVVGVGWHKQRQKWRARIKVGGRDVSLGLFDDYNQAVDARKKAEKRYVQ